MESSPELAGALYVDGHVRIYHGGKTDLPKRFVSRERLCLRGTTDYWVNDALGQPFFLVSRPVDQGMLEALRNDIVPRLLEDIPGQPSAEALEKDPYLDPRRKEKALNLPEVFTPEDHRASPNWPNSARKESS
jgi:prepilin-type processing-associated H-X9-DG protein